MKEESELSQTQILKKIVAIIDNPSDDDAINLAKFVGWGVIAKSILNRKSDNNWPNEARLHMIEKSEFYPEREKVYQYGFYDGYQFKQNEPTQEKGDESQTQDELWNQAFKILGLPNSPNVPINYNQLKQLFFITKTNQ